MVFVIYKNVILSIEYCTEYSAFSAGTVIFFILFFFRRAVF
ncbi:putative membrane protein [Escherichia coli 6-175-07_S3_C3]|nr:putative membrane protein [Escherichia coli 3-267-03_S4_C1]KEM02310.1 putative membrane protein [Escherichia coli 6-175-07_S3_C3]